MAARDLGLTASEALGRVTPLSPYLFLLVADMLQALIRNAAAIRHPIDQSQPEVVLQYADDTLLVMKADSHTVQVLKDLLHMFSEATGLQINYNKSTFVPIHMEDDMIQLCSDC